MSNDLTLTAPNVAASTPGFAERQVMAALRRMTAGCLRIEWPGGSIEQLGTPGADISASIVIRSPDFFRKVMLYGDVGFGEAYVDGDWDTPSIDRVISWAILNVEQSPAMTGSKVKSGVLGLLKIANRLRHLLRPNSMKTARRNISEHYDLGNDFYKLWLDETLTYSSALFSRPDMTLQEAQVAKYDALCQKLQLKASDHVLEIGTGWGGFASHAVRHYGCRVTTVTISAEQHASAKERFEKEGIADRVDVRLQDYRDITGSFDKIASIEMMEALGDAYLETYCASLHRLLTPQGLVGVQYITCPDRRHDAMKKGVDWIQKHIFPGSLLLSIGRVSEAMRKTGDLFLHRLDDMGPHYARTLHEWWITFNDKREQVQALGFSDAFVRKWNYYLQYCEAAFAMRNISVVQAIYTRSNNRSIAL